MSRKAVSERRESEFPPEIRAALKIEAATRDDETKKKVKPFLDKLKVSSEDAAKALTGNARKEYETLKKTIDDLERQKRPNIKALAMTDSGSSAPSTHVFYQGDFAQEREEVLPGIISILDPNATPIQKPKSGSSTGRRTALADWVTSPENPLTARVLVNRLWQHHFGTGLVETPNDFGFSGKRPTNPALLDWLATEFVARGWSIKHIQRMIVLSATYRQDSKDDPARRSIDPENALLWRQNVQRLNSDTLRDALLAASNTLLPVAGGPPVWPELPEEVKQGQPKLNESEGGRLEGWYTSPPEKTFVRSIFLIQKRSLSLPLMDAFDQPDSSVSCPRRNTSTVASQAVMMMNSSFTLNMAKEFAARVAKASPSLSERVENAFWMALSRAPEQYEREACESFLTSQTREHSKDNAKSAEMDALVDLCRALLNVSEFLYVD